jgi:hypothetical protein
MPRALQRTAQGHAQYFDNLRAEEGRRNAAAFGGRKSRSVASNIFPHLNTNSPSTAKAFNPHPRSSIAARLYPHLPSSASARVQQPKPKPRASRARRIYGDLE